MATRSFLISFFLFIFGVTQLRAVTVLELQNRMQESSLLLEGIRSEYIQTVRSSITNEAKESRGIATFKKPNCFHIEQKEPQEEFFISSGKNVYIYTPRFNQVLKDSTKQWLKVNFFFSILSAFAETLEKLKKDYAWKIDENLIVNGEKTIHLTLVKNHPQSGKEILNLWIGESDYIPRKSELITGSLTFTTTLFSLEKNPALKSDFFIFKKPLNTEVINLN